jgi:cytochrome c peroxidase
MTVADLQTWSPAGVVAGLCLLLSMACAPEHPAGNRAHGHGHPPPPGLEFVPPEPGTYSLPPIQAAVDGAVVDADGRARRLLDYMGDKNVLLSFIYTRCTETEGCLLATGVLQMIARELESDPDLAAGVRLISLSFDPERDTPEAMRRYAAQEYVDREWSERPWVFLTTPSRSELQPILDGYGQFVVREFDAEGHLTGNFSHILKVFLIDRDRRVRNIYSLGFLHPAIALNDVRTLLLEDDGQI